MMGRLVIISFVGIFFVIFVMVFVQVAVSESLTAPPLQVHEAERQSVINDGLFPGYKVYDIYDRFSLIVEDFPFGYVGVSEYTWWPDNYRDEDGWYHPRKKKEVGYLYKNSKKSAKYIITYNEKEEIVSKESDGLSVVRIFSYILAPILGFTKDEIDEEVEKFFSVGGL